jgi:DNA-binding YbaB/EbfC family protein
MTNFQQILQMGQQVQARMSELQTELGNRTVTGSAGGGIVTATADGRGKIREIKIDPSVVGGDVEMLEDLVLAAVTAAQERAEKTYEEELKKVAGGLPLPFQLPNFP